MCEGENPRTTLGDLTKPLRAGRIPEDETLVSEALSCAQSLSLPSGAVVEHDSVDSRACGTGLGNDGACLAVELEGELEGGVGVGVDGRGVMSTTGAAGETTVVSGSRLFFSLMLRTIRSKSSEVMCFSLPRPRLASDSSRTTAGR